MVTMTVVATTQMVVAEALLVIPVVAEVPSATQVTAEALLIAQGLTMIDKPWCGRGWF
jgi:hypothetical protein